MTNGAFRFSANGILLVRSLPSQEDGVARRLAEDLRILSVAYNSLPVEDRMVESFTDLQILFNELGRRFEKDGFRPILHLDAHGSKGGLQFSDGVLVPWERVVELLRRLNGTYRMNLVLSLGVCEGAWAIMGVKGLDRAPFALLLAPRVPIRSKDTEAWARSLFSSVLHNQSLVGALKSANALVEELSRFDPFTFKELFDLAFIGYVRDHVDRAALRSRAARMLRALRRSGRFVPGHAKSHLMELLRFKPEMAEEKWACFAWHDLGSDVAERTPYLQPALIAWAQWRRSNGKARHRVLRRARRKDDIHGRLLEHLKGVAAHSIDQMGREW